MEQYSLQEQINLFFDGWKSIEALYALQAKSAGLTFLSLSVLAAIYEKSEDCTQKVICEKTHLPKQSVNVIIKSFWEQGYIELKEIKSDRRNKLILLTDSGMKYAEETVGTIVNAEMKAMGELTYDERNNMIELVHKIADSLRESICGKQISEAVK